MRQEAREHPPGGALAVGDDGQRPAHRRQRGLQARERARGHGLGHGVDGQQAHALARGHGALDGLVVEGYASVAAAAVDRTGRPVASLGLTFRSDQVDVPERVRLARAVRSVALELSRRLGA